jgi:hypothetical protein
MPKEEPPSWTGISGFVIPFVIGHTSFVICRHPAGSNAFVTFARLTQTKVVVRFTMKTLIVGAAIGALTLGSVLADRPVVQQKVQADNADYDYVTVTGSNLKQKMRKRGIITDTRTGNMITIDQREMQRNGMGDLRSQLSRYPGISISNGR